MSKCAFWLLDINYEIEDHKPELWMWGIDDEGKRVLIIERDFPAYFFLLLDAKEDPEVVLERVRQLKPELTFVTDLQLTRRRLFGEPVQVLRVFCQDPELVPRYSRLLSKVKGVKKCLEDDIRYSMRYLIDNDVRPCGWYEMDVQETVNYSKIQVGKVYIAKSRPGKIEREDLPPLRVLSFFPICYGSKGAPQPEKDPVVILSTATNAGDRKTFAAGDYDDNDVIVSFVEHVREFDPDIIVGYETNARHWQYLVDRARKLGLEFLVDRASTLPHRSVYGHVSITGRANMDMADLADELPEVKVKALENVADFLEVESLEEQIAIDEMDFARYWDDPEKRPELISFSVEKAELILGIFNKMFDYAAELSKLVGLPLDHIGKAAVGFRIEWYLIREAYKIDEIVPARIGRPYIPYAGGIVLEPKPGIHESIAVLDFKSMYPNIMIDKNVSPDTYIHPSEPPPASGMNVAPEVGHRFRKEPPGFYKRVLSSLIAARDEIRAKMKELDQESVGYRLLSAQQKAVKVITNAAYGYAGWIGARWFRKPVAEATTAWGRHIIMSGIEMAGKLGLEVVYGDTDSIFIEHDPRGVGILCEAIKKELGLEIEPERVYRRILFTEAKKRYCGLLPDGSLDIVGLEVVRGDWANVAKNTQEQVLELVLKQRSPEKAVDFVRTLITKLREREIPYRDLVVWKTLTKPVSKYEVNAPHVRAAVILEEEGWALTVGDKVGYVITRGSGRLYERAKPYALASYEEVDTEYYVRKQVVPAALRILSMFGVEEGDMLSPEHDEKAKTLVDFFGETSRTHR